MRDSEAHYGTAVLMNVGLRKVRYTAVVLSAIAFGDRLDIGLPLAWCGHSHRGRRQAEDCEKGLVARYQGELQLLEEQHAARTMGDGADGEVDRP